MKKKGWKELAVGGRIDVAGNAREYETGSWRTFRPVRDEAKCTHCLRCWIYCPDSAIEVKDGKVVGIDLDHCKGCGICADVCPPKVQAIKMVQEVELKAKEGK
ncbi:MAG TPA: 4Fe-4S dicluster domain-containing protein [bacterium]|nr:4Fe-4S dicluster domain-containing protein [bacterium]